MPAYLSSTFHQLPQSLSYARGRSPMIDKIIDKMSPTSRPNPDPLGPGAPPLEESRNPPTNEDTETSPLAFATPSSKHPDALKVLFLSSDTGGGHRASAQSLARQFELLFPGSTYDLVDIVELDGPPPYNTLVKAYKHLSAHPHQWKLVYNVSNTRAYEMLADVHMKSLMERAVRKRILGYTPDVVVSVHPLMTNVPVLACANISKETGKHLPIFTVCTDLGSAHSMWFANGVEKLFVASEQIRDLAMQRGKVPREKIVMSGLPIRHDFAVQAEKMGVRHSKEGKVYQEWVRELLGLPCTDRKTVLVMGGGEGCGQLSNIVDSLYLQFVERGMKALILVVCGRNESLKQSLEKRDWESMKERYLMARDQGADPDTCVGLLSDAGCIDGGGIANNLRRIISSPSMLGTVGNVPGNPFAPTPGGTYVASPGGFASSLPGSRSGSPSPLNDPNSIEVVTESFTMRNGLIPPSESNEGNHGQCEAPEEQTVTSSPTNGDVGGPSPQASNEPCEEYSDAYPVAQQEYTLTKMCSSAQVTVVGLGFITKMADYMVAADVLVTKAGPGTIAEAAALSLPVMLTSFLPGQEEGNVDYVIEGGFGTFVSDSDPHGISDEVASWLLDGSKLQELSINAHKRGAPDAAADIVEAIGESALRWKKINESDDTRLENIGRDTEGTPCHDSQTEVNHEEKQQQ